MIELKPCPFCGSKALLNSYKSRKGFDAYVECTGCLIQMITITFDTQEEAEKEAAEKWNMRITACGAKMDLKENE